ncbi:MAG: TetR/AcrR family transcriptional regulator, partial [Actinomycetota bacterium]|nr:TetR/AcrR family transcriptional regulator [Actinomycetota bacterium]
MKKLPYELSNKLLKAADEFPDGSGFDVSVDDVAALSGVPRATLYYYFSGKDDLVQFYLNELMDRTRVAIEKAAATEGSAENRLTAIMRAVVGAFAQYPQMCLEMPTAFKASDDHAEFLGNIDRSVMTPLRQALQDGADADELVLDDVELATHAIMGALHQVSIMRL